jgi:hypothetical protein
MGRVGDYIQTFSGVQLFPFDPRVEEIRLADIAHALARVSRYTGHTRGDFALSVAEHSVLVSRICDPAEARAGLLHDGSDLAFGDIARPLKYMPEYAAIRAAEAAFQAVVYARFGLAPGKPASVHRADNVVLAAEVAACMPEDPAVWDKWIKGIDPTLRDATTGEPLAIRCLPPVAAERLFLDRFAALFPAHAQDLP